MPIILNNDKQLIKNMYEKYFTTNCREKQTTGKSG
jgi:hypothetical protein